ncbi:MAG: cytoplasmic protein [Deltaproteobacteria bacterium]
MRKFALFAYNGDAMCFIHVLLNALDMRKRGHEVKLIIEGSATKLVPDLANTDNPMHELYESAKSQGLIEGACKACATKMGSLEGVKAEGLPLLDEMMGHPSIARYRDEGFEIVTF